MGYLIGIDSNLSTTHILILITYSLQLATYIFMNEFALTLNLKNDQRLIEEYKAHHREVWPEVLNALKKVGILEMKIFLLQNRLFMYMITGDDFKMDENMKVYLEDHPKIKEWEELMDQYQERLPKSKNNEKWLTMEKIFQL